jgi:hypothetical protein
MHNPLMALEFTTSYVKDSTEVLRYYKRLAEKAIAQVHEDMLAIAPDGESNSIATIVRHLSGNMRSRWKSFLDTDGEEPDRNRDGEFEQTFQTRAELMAVWEAGWLEFLGALASLTDADLGRKVTIRGEAHSVMQAINRGITHLSYHVGQIVYLAKHFSGGKWKSLTIPRGKSAEFNAAASFGTAQSAPSSHERRGR